MCLTAAKFVALASFLTILAAHQNAAAQDATLRGPEAKDVAPRVAGYVVRTRSRMEIVAMALPAMKETVVHCTASKQAESYPTLHAVSGPDATGRIAYIEDHFHLGIDAAPKHLLKTIQLDGRRDTEVFSRPASALLAAVQGGRGEIGTHLALAPRGGKAALLSGLSERQLPGKSLYEGDLEIWDVDKCSKRDTGIRALDQPLSWFPDGKRLAYTKLTLREELEKQAAGLKRFGDYRGNGWSEIPAIYAFNIETGDSEFLHVGWTPIVSCDGREILVGGWDNRAEFSWNRFTLESRESVPVKWPGNVGGAIAMPADKVVLYTGLPTAGPASKRLKTKSPLPGPQPKLTLKLAVLDSNEFQTLVPDVESQDFVSFGSAAGQH